MKILSFISVLTLSMISFAQKNELNLITASGQYNANIWLPLDATSQKFKDSGGKINVVTWKSSVSVTFFRKQNYPIRFGVSYNKISHTVVDRIKSAKYTNYYSGAYLYTFDDPMDLHSRSHNVGLILEPMWQLVKLPNSAGLIGLNASFYFLEFYRSEYKTTDYLTTQDALSSLKPMVTNYNNFSSVSSSSLELFYLHNFNLKPNFSLGVRASVGTNLYSNWAQFKRFIWAGVGLEVGFGGSGKPSVAE